MRLIRIARGKSTVIEVGDRRRLKRRMDGLRKSTMRGVSGRMRRKYRVEYRIEDDAVS